MLLSNKGTRKVLVGIMLTYILTIPTNAICSNNSVQHSEEEKEPSNDNDLDMKLGYYSVPLETEVVGLSTEETVATVDKLESIEQEKAKKLEKEKAKKAMTASNGTTYKFYEVYDKFYGSKDWHFLSKKLQKYTYELCIKYEIEEYYTLILTQLYYESQYRADAISPSNDYGIAQINICNHASLREKLGITDFLDPYQSILCNIYMMSGYLKNTSAKKALVWYNAGNPNSTNSHSLAYSANIMEMWDMVRQMKE